MTRKTKKKLPEGMRKMMWKPGQPSPNPQGGRAHDPIKKALKALTIKNFQRIVKAVCIGNLDELRRIAEDPKTPALQVGVAIALGNAIKAGDFATLRTIISDVVGKVPEQLIVTSNNTNRNANLNASISPDMVKAALEKLDSEI